jgi:hypothetical protein
MVANYSRFLTVRLRYRLRHICVAALLMIAAAPAYGIWFRGKVNATPSSEDEFSFHTRWWPELRVKVLPSATVTCRKSPFAVTSLQRNDDVEVVGRIREGIIVAKKVKVHRKSAQCGNNQPQGFSAH